VAAASNRPPLVGWLNFGMACLRREEFSEAEHYFGLVIERGRELEHGGTPENKAGLRPDAIVDDRLDERLWPLALVRAWAHVGLVLSWLDRDARQKDAEAELNAAEDLLESLYGKNTPELAAHERFPTRIRASIAEVRGRLSLVNDDSRTAVPQLEAAISQYPYSRAYAILADALERQVDRRPESEARRRAIKLAQFATRFAPADSVPAETHEVRCRLGIEDQDASHAAAAAPHTPHGAPDNGG
jgi:hypothetical protein